MRQWSQWCVGIYPTRSDLPILARSTLSTMAPKKEVAVEEAKQKIDRILERLNYPEELSRAHRIVIAGLATASRRVLQAKCSAKRSNFVLC